MKEQYSRTSIFKRIYQHCTPREYREFNPTANHPLSEFLTIEKNFGKMLGGCRVQILRRDFQFFQQSKFKILQLFVPNNKRLRGYTQ
jgi:hypothetical protein